MESVNIPRRRLNGALKCICCGLLVAAAPAADAEMTRSRSSKPSKVAKQPYQKPDIQPEPWTTLPPTPELPRAMEQGIVAIDGIRIFYVEAGVGEPVIFLHAGLANSNYWSNQLLRVSRQFRAIAMDTRGHGRSSMSEEPLSYKLLASDVIALMDSREIRSASIVGWSDGAIVGLELAMRRPDRITKLFAFGANYNLMGLQQGGGENRTFRLYVDRCRQEYKEFGQTPANYNRLRLSLSAMWRSQPNYKEIELSSISCPTAIVAGQHDEIIRPQHTKSLAAAISTSTLIIEPSVSHFAMLQNPSQFTNDLLRFLKQP